MPSKKTKQEEGDRLQSWPGVLSDLLFSVPSSDGADRAEKPSSALACPLALPAGLAASFRANSDGLEAQSSASNKQSKIKLSHRLCGAPGEQEQKKSQNPPVHLPTLP